MSFEFLRSTGFSPCGVPFGAVRENHCYTAPCRAFADGVQDNFIRWYFVPDDRPFYPDTHVFSPRVDDCYEASGFEYEKTGLKPNPRKHYSGRDVWHREGTQVDGDASDFMGESLSAKYSVGGYPPPIPCVEPEHIFGGLAFGAKKFHVFPQIEQMKAGLKLGGVVIGMGEEVGRAGLALGGVGLEIVPAVEARKAGLQLGGVGFELVPAVEARKAGINLGALGVESVPAVETKEAGLNLGAIGFELVPAVEARKAGVQLGGVGLELLPAVEVMKAGLNLGGVVFDVVEELKAGLALGGLVFDPSSAVEAVKAGLALGGKVIAVAAPPPSSVPGETCGTAGLVTLGTLASFTVPANGSHWWKFPFNAATTYFVKVTVTAGQYPSTTVSKGSSCANLTSLFFLTSLGTCNTFNQSPAANCYVQIFGPMFSPATYTLLANVGGCP